MLAELLATPGVTEECVLRGPLGVIALHGGLESHTETAARSIAAAANASLYTVVQPDDFRWHVPSIEYDPRQSSRLSRFLEHVSFAVSVHGFGRPGYEETVLLGGTHERVASLIEAAISRTRAANVIGGDAVPPNLAGRHPRNPVNLPTVGGVQLELSVEARRPGPLQEIVAAVAGVLTSEASSLSVVG